MNFEKYNIYYVIFNLICIKYVLPNYNKNIFTNLL